MSGIKNAEENFAVFYMQWIRERETSLIETSLQLECILGAIEKGNAANSRGRIFDTLCKLNFRVEPDEEDGDKGTRKEKRRETRLVFPF